MPTGINNNPSSFFTFHPFVELVARIKPKYDTGIKKYPDIKPNTHLTNLITLFITTSPNTKYVTQRDGYPVWLEFSNYIKTYTRQSRNLAYR